MNNRCRCCGEEDFIPYFPDGVPRCPTCGSKDIDSEYACILCGRYSLLDYCKDCTDNLRKRFHDVLTANFAPEEIAALNEIFDGKELE